MELQYSCLSFGIQIFFKFYLKWGCCDLWKKLTSTVPPSKCLLISVLSNKTEKGLQNQIISVSSQTWRRWLSPVWGCRRCSYRVGFLWWVVLVIVVVCMLLVSGLIHINTSFASAATHVSNSFPDAELHSSQIFHNLFDAISRNNKNIFCQLSPFDQSSPLGGGKVFFVLKQRFFTQLGNFCWWLNLVFWPRGAKKGRRRQFSSKSPQPPPRL